MKSVLFSLVLVFLFTACQHNKSEVLVAFGGHAQGTYYAVQYYAPDSNWHYQNEVDSLLAAFDQSVSAWEPTSILSRINRGEQVPVDSVFRKVFERSQAIGKESNGAFDMTVGPLVNAWGFGFKNRMHLQDHQIDSLLQYVDYRMVDIEGDYVVQQKPGVVFDFNAIAQGYSVDLIGAFLETKGVQRYLIDVGGEVLAKGLKTNAQAWRVGIERPDEKSPTQRGPLEAIVPLTDRALATSGNYRKFYIENGVKYAHTLNPETGYPVTHSLLSVSVLAPDCMSADAYATTFMVMGLQKARAFLKERSDLEALFIYSDEQGLMQTEMTPGLKSLIEEMN